MRPKIDSKIFNNYVNSFIENRDQYWNTLSKENQLLAFCTVIQKLYDGEKIHKKNYRGVLYDIFGFKEDAYMKAQCSGFIEIHNCLCDTPDEQIIKQFLVQHLD